MNYLKHIFYYTFYKNYRILISNTWVFTCFEYPGILFKTIYDSLDGEYSFIVLEDWCDCIDRGYALSRQTKGLTDNTLSSSYKRSFSEIITNQDNHIVRRDVSKDVSQFFIIYHKDKLILSEDKLSYQRDKKLKELGI